jgi:hypothetical protein
VQSAAANCQQRMSDMTRLAVQFPYWIANIRAD